MRKLIATILSLFIFSALAVGLNEKVPVQSYEQARTPTVKVQKKIAATKAKVSKTPKANASAPPSVNYTAVRTLQAELTQVNQNSLRFQQKTDEKILLLSNQVNELAGKLARMQKVLILLSNELVSLHKTSSAMTDVPALLNNQKSEGNSKHWMDYWEGRIGMWGVILFMVVVLVILAFMARMVLKSNKPKETPKKSADTDDEYDYMGSEESTPARLNLARAYIKMEDFNSAREVLDEVIKNGSEKQQQEARELKKKCQ